MILKVIKMNTMNSAIKQTPLVMPLPRSSREYDLMTRHSGTSWIPAFVVMTALRYLVVKAKKIFGFGSQKIIKPLFWFSVVAALLYPHVVFSSPKIVIIEFHGLKQGIIYNH